MRKHQKEESDRFNYNVGRNIRELRKAKDLTQLDLAVMLDIEQATYNRYEKGKTSMPPYIIGAIARIYNVSADIILHQLYD